MTWVMVMVVVAGTTAPACCPGAEPGDVEFFERKIRPLLVERCFECHAEENAESQLRLDGFEHLLRGGTRGPAIVVGQPEQSLLISAVRHGELLKMPPKSKLSAGQIADLVTWIARGAAWPNADSRAALAIAAAETSEPTFSEAERSFWSFQTPIQPPLPPVDQGDWVRSPIDRFVLKQLEAQGLRPAPPADRRTLIRRATLDLTGLPPAPEEVAAFVADEAPDAFARLVDRLLASPAYGERWGRHWLDVARYADSNGLDENLAYANAFHYRDYVIAALNKDKPFDRFVQEQIAGDLLAGESGDAAATAARAQPSDWDAEYEGLIATGFLSLGAKMLAEDDPVKMQMDIIDEQVDTLGRAFLGLTFGCARCHDHKFDPLRMTDYYGIAGIFKSTKTMENFQVVARWQERPLAAAEDLRRRAEHAVRVSELQAQIDRLQSPNADRPADAALLADLQARKKDLEASLPPLPEAMAVSEGQAEDLRIHLRGSHLTLGPSVPRRWPAIFADVNCERIGAQGSGRLELARWMTAPDHPLTPRVIVNRVWLWHFGEGLVRSPDNFGRLGERPTHPELLDWLSCWFVEQGWSLKELHRLLMLSATYQMSAEWNESSAEEDPDNRWLWRFNRRRLEVEAIRDSILAVSGQLDLSRGGSLLPTENRKYVTSTANVNPVAYQSRRRAVYLPVVRSALYEVFQAFDFAEPSVSTSQRQATTVPTQALFMMNSQFVAEQARAMAEGLLAEDQGDDDRVRRAYSHCYGREPLSQESARALQFVRRQEEEAARLGTEPSEARVSAWQSLCRALFSANEFVYID